jgi:hypothetical protein
VIDPASDLWDTLRVGTMRSPGVILSLGGPGLEIGWDIKQADAKKGATTTRINEPLKKFDAEFYLSNTADDLNVSDFDLWDDFQDMLESSVAGEPKALDVFHPAVARARITAVTVASIGLVQPDGKGGGKVKVAFIEHRPPKPARAAAPQKKTAGDEKIDAKAAELKALQEEWKTL